MHIRVQKRTVERRARHAQRRLEQFEIPDACDPAVAAHLIPMDLQDFLQAEKLHGLLSQLFQRLGVAGVDLVERGREGSWARRLKRVFGVEIQDCARCQGRLRVIASIEEPEAIARILAPLENTAPNQSQPELPLGARAPPWQASLL